MSNEQKLIDMMFELAMVMQKHKGIRALSREDLAEWVARNLRDCGFDTVPIGSSWGVLQKIT